MGRGLLHRMRRGETIEFQVVAPDEHPASVRVTLTGIDGQRRAALRIDADPRIDIDLHPEPADGR